MDLLQRLLGNETTPSEAGPSERLLGGVVQPTRSASEGGRTSSAGARVEGAALSAAGTATRPDNCCPWTSRYGDCYHCPMCGWCTP